MALKYKELNDDMILLGKAIKYAGIHGVTLMFHGKNREFIKK